VLFRVLWIQSSSFLFSNHHGDRRLLQPDSVLVVHSFVHDDDVHLQALLVSATPMTYAEAMHSPDADEWRKACDEELASLMQQQVWEMEIPPPGTRVVRSKWVFKQKLNAMGLVERYKARLVTKGFTQRAGIGYDKVWAPVGKHATFRTLVAVAAASDLELHHKDVKTALLHGELEEAIWMQPPEGYELGPDGGASAWKSIYGLGQASKAWHSKLCFRPRGFEAKRSLILVYLTVMRIFCVSIF
jgi:hypothetical protein